MYQALLRLLAGAMLLLAGQGALAMTPTDVVACVSDVPAPPYTLPDGIGYSQYVAARAAEVAGLRLRTVIEPRKRCLENVREGRYQLLLIVADDPSYLVDYAFPLRDGKPDTSRTVGYDIAYLVATRPRAVGWDGQTLQAPSRPLLVRSGSQRAAATLRRLGVPYQEVSSPLQMYYMLQAHRADAGVMRGYDLERLCRLVQCEDRLFRQQPQLFATYIYIVANKPFAASHAETMARFWQEVGRIVHAPGWVEERRRLDAAIR